MPEKPPTNPLVGLLQTVKDLQQFQNAAMQFEPVEVKSGEIISGDVELEDGTKLRLNIVVSQVNKIVGVTGAGGRPLYQIETQVVPSIKEWKK
jgi:hypothetical protein